MQLAQSKSIAFYCVNSQKGLAQKWAIWNENWTGHLSSNPCVFSHKTADRICKQKAGPHEFLGGDNHLRYCEFILVFFVLFFFRFWFGYVRWTPLRNTVKCKWTIRLRHHRLHKFLTTPWTREPWEANMVHPPTENRKPFIFFFRVGWEGHHKIASAKTAMGR